MPRAVTIPVGDRKYEAVVGRGTFAGVGEAASALGPRRAGLITQHAVSAYADDVEESLVSCGLEVVRCVMGEGEAEKSWETAGSLLERLAAAELHRDDVVVGVGGGAVTDTAGFVAATLLRGVRWISCSTTVLGALDAAVGGKTGVNLRAGKNLAGAFWQPSAVFVDTSAFDSLPRDEVMGGLAEAVKYGFIADPEILDVIGRWGDATAADPVRRAEDDLDSVIARGIAVKAGVVAEDEREQGRRAILNYGHTLGHALETATDFRLGHGAAIAVGMVFAAELAHATGRIDSDIVGLHRHVLRRLDLPVSAPRRDIEAALPLMRRDKKATRQGLRFVLLEGLGRPAVVGDVPEAMVEVAAARVSDPAADP